MTLTQDSAIQDPATVLPTPSPTPQAQRLVPVTLDYDLVIVGGGLVGLTLACALKDSGLQIALVEAKPESVAIARGQAYHINLMSSRIYAGLGLWESMRSGVNPIEQIHLSDADFPPVVQFGPRDLGTDVLGYVAAHQVILEALQADLRAATNITYLCPVTVEQRVEQTDSVVLAVMQAGERREIRTRLVVGSDGMRSPLRQQAGIPTWGWQYWQSCVVAFVQPERSHRNIAYERFWPSGPFAILPLPQNLCRIVWTAPRAEAEAILALDDAQFLIQLKQRYGQQMGELKLVGDRYIFPVHLMHSREYTQSRLVLIGDAAHCCHPVGGQGVNLGIRDAAVLAEVLQAAHGQGEDIGDRRILRRYERRRKLENWVILGFTDILNRLFSNTLLPLVIGRRSGLVLIQHLPPLKQLALRLMTGLLGRVPQVVTQAAKRDAAPK